ncbi:MAG TPA: hypothetical protein VK978_05230 [Candidatus Saccharimonadales bacterium]|nr:hypothetical protein [Candidatus Saccharimonadales bacterium]
MKMITISTKEIRQDLEGFLRKLKQGQAIQVLHRSKPLVTVVAQNQQEPYLADDAGTPAAARRSARFVRSLPERKPVLDPHKSFKELYDETLEHP